jgi:hypothetical protein
MAKKAAAKKSVNKSKAIRDHAEKHPDDGPIAIAGALGKRSIEVTAAFVSTVRSNDKRKTNGNGRKVRRGKGGELDDTTVRALTSAKKLVDEAGSVAAAKAAFETYGKLLD